MDPSFYGTEFPGPLGTIEKEKKKKKKGGTLIF